MHSIQTRLAAGLLLSLIVLLLAQWLIVANSIEYLSEQYITSSIIHNSDLLVATINIDKSGKSVLDESRIDPVYSKPFSGFYYTIKINDQLFRSRSLWDESLPVTTISTGSAHTTRTSGPQGQELLLVTTAYSKQQNNIQITVAEDITDITQDIHSLLFRHGMTSLAILILLISLQTIIVRNSLRPLDKTRKDLIKLENGLIQSLDENVPREIFNLVHEINLRIDAFRQRLERSRRATGNLAHALKRPLTLLSQLSQDPDLKNNANTAKALQQYTAEIKQIIDRELKRARLAGTVIGTQQTDLEREVKALIKTLQAMYREKELNIDLATPVNCTSGMDREDLHEMLGNILDNACKWASHHIQINISCDNKLVIKVDDDGPGIPAKQSENILNRGTRLDEQVTGHGLGLAIVKDIIEEYQGTIVMTQSEQLGGLCTEIVIPWHHAADQPVK